jgi:hypothetical protein
MYVKIKDIFTNNELQFIYKLTQEIVAKHDIKVIDNISYNPYDFDEYNVAKIIFQKINTIKENKKEKTSI